MPTSEEVQRLRKLIKKQNINPEQLKKAATRHTLAKLKELAQFDMSGPLQDIIDAIESGGDHILLELWKSRRVSGRPKLTSAEKCLMKDCVSAVEGLFQNGIRKQGARELVADIANQTGVFHPIVGHRKNSEITPNILNNWARDKHGTIGEKVDPDFVRECGNAFEGIHGQKRTSEQILNDLGICLIGKKYEPSYDDDIYDDDI
jgi:hypothetical protein